MPIYYISVCCQKITNLFSVLHQNQRGSFTSRFSIFILYRRIITFTQPKRLEFIAGLFSKNCGFKNLCLTANWSPRSRAQAFVSMAEGLITFPAKSMIHCPLESHITPPIQCLSFVSTNESSVFSFKKPGLGCFHFK
ncbi:uncharacterized protein LOC129905072 [Solanum dulcamara]|uniref:uncharacterized protein LOC129905072 n=1 Tax=Solanum dulcamara TaxID=45834 RepID=UPI00248594DA|nr:uncharacterized protein LOC129905072 [Solanum dulcamara]